MTTPQLPVLATGEPLHPVAESLQIKIDPPWTATITIPASDPDVAIRQRVRVYNQNGFIGIFRVTNLSRQIGSTRQLRLTHCIDELADTIIPLTGDEAEKEAGAADIIRQALSYQPSAVWALGTCELTDTVKASLQYVSVFDVITGILDRYPEYYLAYDQTVTPWLLHVKRRGAVPESEFRLSRNISDANVTLDDSELCTRLHLSVTTETHDTGAGSGTASSTTGQETTHRIYNADTQNTWGVVERTVGINAEDEPDPDKFAERYFRDYAQPALQISINGLDLRQLSGDTWDEAKIGTVCRLALPEMAATWDEVCTEIEYPDVYGQPEHVRVSLATRPRTASGSIAMYSSSISALSSQIRSVGGSVGGVNGDLIKAMYRIVDTETVLDEAGIYIDPVDGVWMFAKEVGGLGTKMSEIRTRYDSILEVVTDETTGNITSTWKQQTIDNISQAVGRIEIAEDRLDAVEGSALWQDRDDITAAVGTMHVETVENADGTRTQKLVIDSGGGLAIQRNGATLGVWDSGNLTAGILIDKINGGTTTISSARINLEGYVTATTLSAEIESVKTGFANHIVTADIDGADGYFNVLGCGSFTYGSTNFSIKSVKVDGKEVAKVMGTADVNFDRAAAVEEGVASGKAAMGVSVAQSGNGWVVKAVESSVKERALTCSKYSDSYSTSTHKYTVNFYAQVSGTNYALGSWTSGTEAYEAGQANGDSAQYKSGYSDGWKDAAKSCGRSGNAITYPTAVVGEKEKVTVSLSRKEHTTPYLYTMGQGNTPQRYTDTLYDSASISYSVSQVN